LRERWGIALLVAFVALDLVLVALAVRHTSQAPPPAPAPAARSEADPSDIGSDAGSSPSPSASAASTPAGRSAQPVLAVTSDGTVVRATRGSCSDGTAPVVDVSQQRGRGLTSGSVHGLSQTLRVVADSDTDLSIVGLDSACDVATFTSSDGGGSWSSRDGAAGLWRPSPAPRKAVVYSPRGRYRTPCSPKALAPVDGGVARLLCRDGRVSGTSDAGSSWLTLGQLDGAVAMSFETPGDGVAVAEQSDCDAAVMRTSDGGASWVEVSCLEGGAPRAVTSAGDTVLAQVGDRLQISTDGGSTWRRFRT
jgi:hypothetical protein